MVYAKYMELPKDVRVGMRATGVLQAFIAMPHPHQSYYLDWINQAKTSVTRYRRIVKTCEILAAQS